MSHLPRRQFLCESSLTAAAIAAATAYGQENKSANDKLNIAIIGPGGMGSSHLVPLAARNDVLIKYVCDPDAQRLETAVKKTTYRGMPEPTGVKDMRRIFDDKTIDAVWIATPDHWHAPAGILACDAGKHVYVEKPCCHNLKEGRLLLDAARRNKRVVQTGHQARSSSEVMRAMQLLKDGAIGDILSAKAWNSQLRGNIGKAKPQDAPAHLDWDLWLGPAPERPYQANLHPGRWRFFYDFGVGDIGNDGVHELDIAHWGLGVSGWPTTVCGIGGKYFFDDDQQFPDNQTCIYEWPGAGGVGQKKQLIFEQRDWSPYVQEGYENGNAFYGTKGMLIMGKGTGFQIFGPKNVPGEKGEGGVDLVAHHQDFIDCIRNDRRPHCDIEHAYLSAGLAHLGNIACRTSRTLHTDPATETIKDDAEATKLIGRTYRAGHWAVPKGAA